MRAEGRTSPSGEGTAAPVWSGQARSRGRMRLPQKTTVILAMLLSVVVAVVGGIFFFSTRSMLKSAQSAQVSSFAYGIAAWYTALVLAMTLIAGYAATRVATRRSVLVDLRDE